MAVWVRQLLPNPICRALNCMEVQFSSDLQKRLAERRAARIKLNS
jgi:hypothetical protein